MRSPTRIVVVVSLGLAACGLQTDPEDGPGIGQVRLGATVAEHLDTSCDDGVVAGLGRQISDEIGCMSPGALVGFSFDGGLVENIGGVMPYLSQAALDSLRAAASQTGVPIYINSGFRTVAAQYLLYNWWQRGRCDLTRVAPPGTSNHESGRALDIQNYGEVLGAMNANGWAHPYPGDDPWHFDHDGSPDIRGMDVHAFQRLWNRNHPEDAIDEDGIYGPATDARLAQAPAEGFPIGTCTSYGATLLAVGGDTPAPAGAERAVFVEIANSGGTTWQPGATFLGTTRPNDRPSAVQHASWSSPSRAATVDAPTAPGETGRFTFTAQVPADAAPGTAIDETFGLVEEGVTWFGPDDIGLHIEVTSATSDGEDSIGGDLSFGCAAGGGAPSGLGLLLALAALAGLRRRR
jgi:MYXO-CTERM domain-containing protein